MHGQVSVFHCHQIMTSMTLSIHWSTVRSTLYLSNSTLFWLKSTQLQLEYTISLDLHHGHLWVSYSVLGYHPAKLWLVFCPWKDSHHPDLNAKIYALIMWYSKITAQPDKDTQMFTFHQEVDMHGECRYRVIELSQIKSICPMAPFIEGECPLDVDKESCSNVFSHFHINLYTLHLHFHWLHNAAV